MARGELVLAAALLDHLSCLAARRPLCVASLLRLALPRAVGTSIRAILWQMPPGLLRNWAPAWPALTSLYGAEGKSKIESGITRKSKGERAFGTIQNREVSQSHRKGSCRVQVQECSIP